MARKQGNFVGMAIAWSLVCVLLAACATTSDGAKDTKPANAAAASQADPNWELAGWRVIGCCCPTPCPCRLNKKPMSCHGCDHTDIVHVDRGSLGGVKMDGVTWVLVGRGFGEDVNGNWVYCYVDEKASEAQVASLQKFLGDTVAAWGPKAPHLAGKFVGLREVPMTVRADGEMQGYGVVIPGVLDFQVRTIVNPGRTDPVRSTGILDSFGDRFVHSDTLVHKLDDKSIGYSWDLAGRQSNHTTFVLNQKRLDQGGIGWGCWSAHSSLGDDDKYAEQLIHHD